MNQIESKLQLVTFLVLKYLQDLGLKSIVDDKSWKEKSSKNVVLMVSVNEEKAFEVFGRKLNELEIVGIDMSKSEKCMINICNDDESLAQGIFFYSKLIDEQTLSFPMSQEAALQVYTKQSFKVLQNKLKLANESHVLRESDPKLESITQPKKDIFQERLEAKVGNRPPPKHDEIPGFDDEYEVQSGPGIPGSGEFGVPGLGAPLGSYGDRDLYPNGMRFPQDFDPLKTSQPNPQGGMVFDPFRGEGPSANPLDGRKDPNKNSKPGSSSFPGIKYDDPYGRIDRQGGGGGFI